MHEAGYISEEELNQYKNYTIDDIINKFKDLGWENITSVSELQVGDIVFINNAEGGNIQIYAGDNKWYIEGKEGLQQLDTKWSENVVWQAFRPKA